MARFFSLGRLLGIALLLLGATSGTTLADHFLTHPAVQKAAAPKPAGTAAVAKPSAAKPGAALTFPGIESGRIKPKPKFDANVYLTPENVPENDELLKAYATDRAPQANGDGVATPGLLGIAAQAYRAQRPAKKGMKSTYSLADAMRDAVWRKKTAAKLKRLFQ
ncbi:MAG: hypothetical protein V3T80_08635 [Kiloniellales bacterium]